MKVFLDGQRIILKKYEPACIFCGQADDMIHFHGKNVCVSCAQEMQQYG